MSCTLANSRLPTKGRPLEANSQHILFTFWTFNRENTYEMFVFMEFYQGRPTSSVENIDHDSIVELIFDSLPRMKRDPDWSFSIGRVKA